MIYDYDYLIPTNGKGECNLIILGVPPLLFNRLPSVKYRKIGPNGLALIGHAVVLRGKGLAWQHGRGPDLGAMASMTWMWVGISR